MVVSLKIGLNLSHATHYTFHYTIPVAAVVLGLKVEVEVGSSEVGLSRPPGDGLTTENIHKLEIILSSTFHYPLYLD